MRRRLQVGVRMVRAVLLAGFTPALRQGSAFQGSAVSTRATSRMTGPVMADAWVRVVPSDTVGANAQADRLVAGAGAFVSCASCFCSQCQKLRMPYRQDSSAAAAHRVWICSKRCPNVRNDWGYSGRSTQAGCQGMWRRSG